MSPQPRPWAVLALALGLGACAKRARSGAAAEAPHYATGAPGTGWTAQAPGGADHAWSHPGLRATIYADANCAERFEDGELTDLLTHISFGIARGAPLRDEPLRLDNRAAHARAWAGALDGVAVHVGAAVTKKDHCVYDFVVIAPPEGFDAAWGAFVRVLEGFSTRGGG